MKFENKKVKLNSLGDYASLALTRKCLFINITLSAFSNLMTDTSFQHLAI